MELQKLQKMKEEIVKNYDTRGSYPETGRLCDKDLEQFRRYIRYPEKIDPGNRFK